MTAAQFAKAASRRSSRPASVLILSRAIEVFVRVPIKDAEDVVVSILQLDPTVTAPITIPCWEAILFGRCLPNQAQPVNSAT